MALWRIRATVDDRPGYLSVLTASLALRSVNILAVQVHTTEAGAVDDFLVDAPDALTEADLLAAVTRGRGRDAFVARAEAQGLADQPTRVLALAARLVHEPDALGEALLTLLDATDVRWRPIAARGPAVVPGFDARRMTLADPASGSFELRRGEPAFTPAEFARAQALIEVSAAVLRERAAQSTLLLPDGSEILLRTSTPDDRDAVRALCDQTAAATPAATPDDRDTVRTLCDEAAAATPDGRGAACALCDEAAAAAQDATPAEHHDTATHAEHHDTATHAEHDSARSPADRHGVRSLADHEGAGPPAAQDRSGWPAGHDRVCWPGEPGSAAAGFAPVGVSEARLDRLLEPTGGVSLVAMTGDEAIGLATIVAEGDIGEVALLVAAGWRGRGIGTALLRRLVAHAGQAGLAALMAHAPAADVATLHTLHRLGSTATDRDGAMVTVTLPLARRQAARTSAPTTTA